MRRLRFSLTLFMAIVLLWGNAYSCAIEFSFRAYLDKRFWQPFAKYEKILGKPLQENDKECKVTTVFAGTATGGSLALQKLRKAYQKNDFSGARDSLAAAMQENPSGKEREEIILVDAKIDMRQGEEIDPGLLKRAKDKLISFLGIAQTPALRSEARGWLARVHYLIGNHSSAAKIYLDEFLKEDSIFSRESLITSLRILFRYNGSSARLADHLDEYFDTPSHALFAVTIVTNPIYFDEDERALMAATAKNAIDVLQLRKDLFSSGPESEALALALMRAALYMGDSGTALTYSQLIPAESDTALGPEFNWMVASCHFLRKDYAAAEAPLLRMYHSPKADSRDRSAAAQALTGVYQKLGRGVDQLHAAFLSGQRLGIDENEAFGVSMYWPANGTGYDLAYLLDVQLTDEELKEYLFKYSIPASTITIEYWSSSKRKRMASEIVQYALAVRYARQEKYVEAARIYEEINALPRVKRMRKLAEIYSNTTDPKLSPQQRLEARFAYGAFIEEHSTQVFFNDMLWSGFQTWTFLGRGLHNFPYETGGFPAEGDAQGLTKKERDFLLEQERKVKDKQEERWRSYKILVSVAEEAGRSELGRRAVKRALTSLRRINIGRFGREQEISAADSRLEKALAQGYLEPVAEKQ